MTIRKRQRGTSRTKQPTAIITGDMHLRDTVPLCRIDDNYFENAQTKKILFIKHLQQQYEGIPVLDAGDLIHIEEDASRRRPPLPWLLTFCIRNLPKMITIPGNHDIPSRNLELLEKAGITTIDAAKTIKILKEGETETVDSSSGKIIVHAFPWGVEPASTKKIQGVKQVALCHYSVYKETSSWGTGIKAERGNVFLKKMKGYDLVITGHNHIPFVIRDNNTNSVLVNPGSLKRDEANQIDHRPRVYLWYADDNTLSPVYIPIEDGVISREHIEKPKERNERLEILIERLKGDYSVEIDFKENLEKFFASNKIDNDLIAIIWDAYRGETTWALQKD